MRLLMQLPACLPINGPRLSRAACIIIDRCRAHARVPMRIRHVVSLRVKLGLELNVISFFLNTFQIPPLRHNGSIPLSFNFLLYFISCILLLI